MPQYELMFRVSQLETYYVEAESLEEAQEIAESGDLPDNRDYIEVQDFTCFSIKEVK